MEDVLISESSIPNDYLYCAKIDELKKWKEGNVYQPVKFIGRNKISKTWVVTEKYINGEKGKKGRLVKPKVWGTKQWSTKGLSNLCKRKSLINISITSTKGWD